MRRAAARANHVGPDRDPFPETVGRIGVRVPRATDRQIGCAVYVVLLLQTTVSPVSRRQCKLQDRCPGPRPPTRNETPRMTLTTFAWACINAASTRTGGAHSKFVKWQSLLKCSFIARSKFQVLLSIFLNTDAIVNVRSSRRFERPSCCTALAVLLATAPPVALLSRSRSDNLVPKLRLGACQIGALLDRQHKSALKPPYPNLHYF
jgi:hypothetical protein